MGSLTLLKDISFPFTGQLIVIVFISCVPETLLFFSSKTSGEVVSCISLSLYKTKLAAKATTKAMLNPIHA